MPQAAFAYARTEPPAATIGGGDLACDLSLSIFADRPRLRGELRDDAEAGGFRVARQADLAALVDAPTGALGDVVLLDCPVVGDGARLAALARLDLCAANSGARLIVSTSVDALDDVFACLDRSSPRILVEPSRAERMIALGEARARAARARVRELSNEDRLVMLRLSEQVGQIARRLDGFTPAPPASGAVVRAAGAAFRFDPLPAEPTSAPARIAPPRARPDARDLPDPRTVRRMIRQRQLRGRFINPELFADPAWDMLLDLTAAAAEDARVSVTSLCIASGVPPTTALRWIGQMTEAGLLHRSDDRTDRRRAFIQLTDRARGAMGAYFAALGEGAALPA